MPPPVQNRVKLQTFDTLGFIDLKAANHPANFGSLQ